MLFQQVNEKLETIKHTITKKERTIPDVKAQVRHLKNQYDEITELRDMGRKVSQLKDELIWSKVRPSVYRGKHFLSGPSRGGRDWGKL